MQNYLIEILGPRAVPLVWLRGEFIGGYPELVTAVMNGELKGVGKGAVFKLPKPMRLKCRESGASDVPRADIPHHPACRSLPNLSRIN